MKITKILLTGGSGMVGKNLLEHPLARNYDILSPSKEEVDLRNLAELKSYLKYWCPDLIVNAAGRVGGIESNIKEPIHYLVDNLDIGRNLILSAFECGVPKLLNLGSSCMYPRYARNPLTESMILGGGLEPTNEGYALAKSVTARLCEYVKREDSTKQYKTIIPCNLYGKYDNFNPESSHLIAAIIYKIHKAKQEELDSVDIWGDGTAKREFMYAADFADAVYYSIENFDRVPQYMNIGVGNDHTINEYYSFVASVLKYEGTFRWDLTKPVGMNKKLLDIERQTTLGWSPTQNTLEGIKKTYEYYLKEFHS